MDNTDRDELLELLRQLDSELGGDNLDRVQEILDAIFDRVSLFPAVVDLIMRFIYDESLAMTISEQYEVS